MYSMTSPSIKSLHSKVLPTLWAQARPCYQVSLLHLPHQYSDQFLYPNLSVSTVSSPRYPSLFAPTSRGPSFLPHVLASIQHGCNVEPRDSRCRYALLDGNSLEFLKYRELFGCPTE